MLLQSPNTSLKICGITKRQNALDLAELGIPALGINFFPPSKRHCSPEIARSFLADISSSLRVGVFVNNARDLAPPLLADHLLDAIQLHGDESSNDLELFLKQGHQVIRAISATDVLSPDLQALARDYPKTLAILLDTPAGKDYGGTGKTFDWTLAARFRQNHPEIPLLLAGGLTPRNAAQAIKEVNPTALDIASGAESGTPGQKDLEKAKALLQIITP